MIDLSHHLFSFAQWHGHGLIKIVIFLIIWGVVWLPIAIPLARLIRWHPSAPLTNSQKLTLITSLYLIAPLLAWGVMGKEGLNQIILISQASIIKSISWTYVVAIITIVIIDSLQWLMGWWQWQKPSLTWQDSLISVVSIFLVSLLVGGIEELMFRGVFVAFLRDSFPLWGVAIISSVIFALLHLVWERENSLPQLPGLFLMGLVLFYAVTLNGGNITTAIGLHGGWVFSIASLDTLNCYEYTGKVSSFWCGKKGEPLASVAGVMVLLLTVVILMNN
ncbi:MAG: CPBP family intramembrane metalloprotease [Cyanobacterium sp. T60_A2020_053]|nr:CPBP family intramembrane metalloprotease [Cyanobacterium sp. T60_A2020_053]